MGKITQVNIAEFRHRITFQDLTEVSDGMGGNTTTWGDVFSVWAKIEPISEGERVFGQKLEYQRSHKVWLRYRDDITTDMRFNFDGRVFQVKAFHTVDERKAYVRLDAEENQGT